MKILVVGSKGFIGSHCVSFFSNVYEVWECDVSVDYDNKRYSAVDATNADYNELFQSNNFDICINCSGAASVPESITHPHKDFVANTYNVSKQLEAIRKFSPNCKYINLSSAAVYGNPQELPMKEEHQQNPISPYGVHKIISEIICKEYYSFFNVHTINVRAFSVYGSGLHKQLFWDIYKKLIGSDVIELFGTGKETRDFIHVKDLVRALDVIIRNANFDGTAINIGNGRDYEIQYLANIIADIYKTEYHRDVKIKFSSQVRKGDPNRFCADINRLRSLGYESQVSIKEGLKDFYLWANH